MGKLRRHMGACEAKVSQHSNLLVILGLERTREGVGFHELRTAESQRHRHCRHRYKWREGNSRASILPPSTTDFLGLIQPTGIDPGHRDGGGRV